MRKRELIKQNKLLKITSKILPNLFKEKYRLKLGEFNNTTGTERVKYTCIRLMPNVKLKLELKNMYYIGKAFKEKKKLK